MGGLELPSSPLPKVAPGPPQKGHGLKILKIRKQTHNQVYLSLCGTVDLTGANQRF